MNLSIRRTLFKMALCMSMMVLSVLPTSAQDEIPSFFDPNRGTPYAFISAPYTLQSSAAIPSEIITGSQVVASSPGSFSVYLGAVRGLPANARDNFLGAFDLLGGRSFTLSPDTQASFGLDCEDILVYKVNRDGSSGLFGNTNCDLNDNLTVRNTDGTGTFLLFEDV